MGVRGGGVDQHATVAHLDRKGGEGLRGRWRRGFAGRDPEERAVARTLDLAILDVPAGQALESVGAGVVDGVKLAVQVDEADGFAADIHAKRRSGLDIVDRGDIDHFDSPIHHLGVPDFPSDRRVQLAANLVELDLVQDLLAKTLDDQLLGGVAWHTAGFQVEQVLVVDAADRAGV